MTCERYWREGVLAVERGERDTHRETCPDCKRAHAARAELLAAMPRVGARHAGDPQWQMKVWSRIARDQALRARRSYWLGGGLAAACAVAMLWLVLRGDRAPQVASVAAPAAPPLHPVQVASVAAADSDRPRVEIVSGPLAQRSTSARVGDRVKVSVRPGGEVRVYRADRLLLRCPASRSSPGCTPDPLGLVAEADLATAGDYQLVLIPSLTADPVGGLDRDLAAVVAARGNYKLIELSVR